MVGGIKYVHSKYYEGIGGLQTTTQDLSRLFLIRIQRLRSQEKLNKTSKLIQL